MTHAFDTLTIKIIKEAYFILCSDLWTIYFAHFRHTDVILQCSDGSTTFEAYGENADKPAYYVRPL